MIEVDRYLNIDYAYGKADHKLCDCFGICKLIYEEQLGIKLNTTEFYKACPDHKSMKLRLAVKLLKEHGFVITPKLSTGAILLGIGLNGFGFALWTGTEIITGSKGLGVYLTDWEHWVCGQSRYQFWSTARIFAEDLQPVDRLNK